MSELSPESRALLDAAREEHPPADGRRRVKARVIAMAREGQDPRSAAKSRRPRARLHMIAVAVGAAVGVAAVLAMIMRSPQTPARRPALEPFAAPDVVHVPAPVAPPLPPRELVALPQIPFVRPAAPHAQRRDAGVRGNVDASVTRDAAAPPPIAPTQDAGLPGTVLLSTRPTSICTVSGRETHSTPWRLTLPAGHYSITCVNEPLSMRATFSVTIAPGDIIDLRNRPLD